MKLDFRTLRADEIDVRAGQKTKAGDKIALLLYKNARVDMALLDEVVGPMNWQREHKELKGVIYCGVSIRNEATGDWASKWDAGTESNTEAQKGEASDSFKRACVNWGIGRELYTAPRIYVPITTPLWDVRVSDIAYNERREIERVVITDGKGGILYSHGVKKAGVSVSIPAPQTPAKTQENAQEWDDNYFALCSDIDAADTIAACKASAALSIGQPYENAIRRKATMRGFELAKVKEDLNDAYSIIKDHEGWQELKKEAVGVAKKKGWI